MVSVIVTAFLMGVLGSFHCVGMCGPLVLSLPLHGLKPSSRTIGLFLYNIGRVTTYSFLGLLIGLFGSSIQLAGLQQWVSILSGVLILFYFLHTQFELLGSVEFFTAFFEFIRKKLGKLYFKKSLWSVFFIGILNGFLPCGFVYLAFAGALATGAVSNSILFMASFGLGTIPAMWTLVFLGTYAGAGIQIKFKKIYPFVMLLVSCLLIIRGLGLGIPYISPAMEIKNGAIHSCCHK